jgi:hypothetical protein
MNKRLYLSFVLLMGLICVLPAEGVISLVSEIFLIDSEIYQKYVPPGRILIGVEMESDVLYKLSSQSEVLQGGLLRKGFNSLSIDTQGFFEKSGSHKFVLETKVEDSLAKKEITIDVQLMPLYVVQKRGEEKKKYEYTVSLFVGDRLIYSTRKFALGDLSFKLDLPPSDGVYNPFGLIDGRQPPLNTFSIPDAIAGLYQLAKTLTSGKGKESQDKTIQKKQQIETTYVRRNASGDLWQWRALILLNTKDLDKDGPT